MQERHVQAIINNEKSEKGDAIIKYKCHLLQCHCMQNKTAFQ